LPWQAPRASTLLTLAALTPRPPQFDLTILSIHTGGAWPSSPASLSSHVRPLFYHLISAALAAGMSVAVVTFSPQVPVIREVLALLFPQHASRIPIRGGDRSWSYEGGGSAAGKQAHMASAVVVLGEGGGGGDITRASTLLIDDDANNISVALAEGVRAIWLNPKDSDRLLENITDMI
jgi:hypothetical protein